jgi:hypothetical protein
MLTKGSRITVRYSPGQFALALTVLVALLFLGNSQAPAGYLGAGSVLPTEKALAEADVWGQAPAGMAILPQGHDDAPEQKDGPLARLHQLLLFTPLCGQTQRTGGGLGGTSGGPDSGGSGQQAGCFSRVPAPRVELVGLILADDAFSLPPPFPARLFHPPRPA